MLRLWKVEEFFLQAVSILTDRKIGHQEYVSFYFLAAINSFLTGRQISFSQPKGRYGLELHIYKEL